MKFFSLKYADLIVTLDPKTFSVESGFRIMKGMNGLYPTGLSITFQKREFDTKSMRFSANEEARLIKILKSHPSYGVHFVSENYQEEQEAIAEKKRQADADRDEVAGKAADTNHEKPIKQS